MPLDVAMGRGAGVRTIAVTYGNASREELEMSGADVIIDSFDKLMHYI
jgi:phosphoglycolate phosphatase